MRLRMRMRMGMGMGMRMRMRMRMGIRMGMGMGMRMRMRPTVTPDDALTERSAAPAAEVSCARFGWLASSPEAAMALGSVLGEGGWAEVECAVGATSAVATSGPCARRRRRSAASLRTCEAQQSVANACRAEMRSSKAGEI